ncbi:hypothetical protein BOW53_09200 [Solemya pervernicosa gill symbiont]|uniref:SSD domain-containing protein n=2 Tax=Gammaproteobacteria incertae sedis TaxID=118884 RepID=A0A1T2L4P2_9GAMM|nr:MMPL family transporter [Candidatus Reidiella endopervernicosa]OOZ40063.1 hypothetical protein BOW53_09200 [Solemya pervernicosa gill symbiont]QKQ27647.1 MMPL family transporter [Candidatus Reidiella endopervernicosa]
MTTTFRQRIEHGFESFGALIYRNHWKALLIMLLIAAALISQMHYLTMDTSTEGFLHEEDPILLDYNAFREQFGRDEMVILSIDGSEVFSTPFLQRLQSLHMELRDNTPYLDDITSLVNARNTRGAVGELIVEDLLETIPKTAEEMDELKARALANPVYRNMLLSEDGTITTIVLRTDAYSSVGIEEDVMGGFDDIDATTEEPDEEEIEPRPFLTDAENSELIAAVNEVIARHQGSDFRIQIAGSPVVGDALKRSMQNNMKRFMGLALLTVSLALFLLFRRLSGVILPLLTVALSIVSTLGIMGMLGIPFKLPTQILPSFLLAVGVGASVHLLTIFFRKLQQLHDETDGSTESSNHKESAIVYALGHSGLAIAMTSITTAAGLASFAGAEVAPISDLGMIAASGVMLSLLYTLVLLPTLLSIMPIKAKQSGSASSSRLFMDRLLVRIANFSTQRANLVLVVCAVVLAVGLAGAVQVNFSHKPFEWFEKEHPIRMATDFVDSRMKGASSVEVIVDTGKENGLYEPKIMQALDRLGPKVEAIDHGELFVGKSLSVADILKESNKALNENRAEFYAIPNDRQLIAQELLLFENSGSDDLEDFVDSQFSKARFTARMPWVDGVLYEDFIDELELTFREELGSEVKVWSTGMATLLGRTMGATIFSMAQSYVIAAVVITFMMILLIGDIKIGLVSMIPNLTPIILTLGIMGWVGMPLDVFTMLIGSIAIGLAVDDTIHFMHNYRRYHHETGDVDRAVEETLLGTGRAMLVTTVVLSLGFFLYMFADLSNLFNFGLLTGFTIIMALLADFFLAPALMAVLHRKHMIDDDSDY